MKKNKKVKKQRKLKKWQLILLTVFSILLTLSIGIGVYCYILYQNEQENINNIKSHYNGVVETTKNTNFYTNKNGSYKKYGSVSKNITFELEKLNITSSKQKYFKVKNEDYYLYYNDVKKTIKKDVLTFTDNKLLILNKNIKTNNTTKLVQEQKYLEINKNMEFEVLYIDDNYYYVLYNNEMWKVEKNDNIEIYDSKNREDNESNYISVFVYDTNNKDKINDQLKHLKEKGYYTITLDEYKNWLKGYISLKEKAILLTLDTNNDDINKIVTDNGFNIETTKDSGIKFVNNNKTTTKESNIESLNRYLINDLVDLESFKKMVNGEEVIIKKPEIIKNPPSENAVATKIAVLNYHFFYDSSLGENCGQGICLDVKKFREQLEYLKNNNYKTLTIEEFREWMYGEIELPARSVLLTIDDGALGTGRHNGNKLIPLLEEYNMHATLFLITGWWDKSNYTSPNLDIESHTNDMHTEGLCSNQSRGAQLLCSSKEQVMQDLKTSIEILGSNAAFCFPFYAYNNDAIESVKESGFKLAFIGGNTKATRSHDKYKIPRYPIYNSTTLNQFKNYIN